MHEAARILRSHFTATLVAAGVAPRMRYVVNSATGLAVSPVEGGVLEGEEWVLHIPEEGDSELELLVTPRPVDPATFPACDRFLIYHGTPDERHWVEWEIESGRCMGEVVSEEDCRLPNVLSEAEPALCKKFNEDRDGVGRLCLGSVKMRPVDPLLVGIDQFGADVKAKFGIIRVEFPRPAAIAEEAVLMMERMMAAGGAGEAAS